MLLSDGGPGGERYLPLFKMIAYFDCASGIAGNMTIGAFLDLGVDFSWLERELRKLGLSHYHLKRSRKTWSGRGRKVQGVFFDVALKSHEHRHRHFGEIRDLIRSSDLPTSVVSRSLKIFRMLGEAEAKVHRTTLENVHFHEVGAVDALIDIVGTSLCVEKMNVTEIFSSPLNIGHGRVRAAHGWMNVPPPATHEMLGKKRIPHYSGSHRLEMSTPTGTAILAALATSFGPLPALKVRKHGYGFGSHRLSGAPDALHVALGELR